MEIVSCLNHEFKKPNENVFDWGSTGDKFFIILHGTVNVLIPHPDIKDAKIKIEESR